jgi:DEAD/DEAH box helicase domain-containing protein
MPVIAQPTAETREDSSALAVLRAAQRAGELVHLEHIPGQPGQSTSWPETVRPEIAAALAARGIAAPWTHQARSAAAARAGDHVIIATRAASGKSAGYLAAALSEVLDGGTVLYIAPTKALAADQLKSVRDLRVPGVRPACYDGDSSVAERAWAQSHANYLLTNPDMIHNGLLPNHARWRGFFRRLRVVIVDECHGYRGVFGSHVAHVLRRLRRVSAYYGAPAYGAPAAAAGPVFILASATIGDPQACARALTGLEAVAVTDDGAPRAPVSFALWEPPLRLFSPGGTTPRSTPRPPRGAPDGKDRHRIGRADDQPGGIRLRKSATTEAADLLAQLVNAQVPALAFIRSRRGAETVALAARDALDDEVSGSVAAYRSGYLADDRRGLEAALRDGRITGMAATTALELGINITGLDAVLIAGWPGTWSSLWQQAGRAGRAGQHATAVFIARDDPLDSYLIHHPDTLLHHPLEPAILDPANPYVLGPQLTAAAAELPLTDADLDLFGPTAAVTAAKLGAAGELRKRPSGWYYAGHGRPARDISLRGDLGRPVLVVEEATGRLVGTMDEPSAHRYVHDGAVYLHQGDPYVVRRLDLADRVALVEPGDPGFTTQARDTTDIDLLTELRRARWGSADLMLAQVQVTRQVVGYSRIRSVDRKKGPLLPLELPQRTLPTTAVLWTIPNECLDSVPGNDLGGAAHAAEHAAIGLLPLFATCDRWDVGGMSTELHPATGQLTVFVYDGHAGGAGFAERGFQVARDWLTATRHAIDGCPCETGCPSCVQSPKCGNGNSPLNKAGAVALLDVLLGGDALPATPALGCVAGVAPHSEQSARAGWSG